MANSSFTEGLNPEQRLAAEHNHGPLLILAGAGSGKTTVLVSRAGRLLTEQICSPEKLLVLTFTNKAARELKDRVSRKLGNTGARIWAGTFHSFGLFLLRKYHKTLKLSSHFGILDASDAGALVKELLQDFNNAGKTAYDADRLLHLLSHYREHGIRSARNSDEYEVAVEWLLPRYEKRLTSLGMVDFDGLILKPVELMKDPKIHDEIKALFEQVMVDEFQDTNVMQMGLIRKLVEGHKNISVVGDDDQSIYAWRGACISNILNFPKLYPGCKVVRLEQNYRSTPQILAMANSIIAKNTERHPKVLRASSAKGEGDKPEVFSFATEEQEVEFVVSELENFYRDGKKRKELAVLYRSNSQGALLEAELRKNQIPYVISGGTAFFDRKETRDVLAYLRSALRPNEIALRRILNTPPRGIGDKTVEMLTDHAHQHHVAFIGIVKNWRNVQPPIEPRAGEAIDGLFAFLAELTKRLVQSPQPPSLELMRFLEEIGYKRYLEKTSPNAMLAGRRWKFLEIFGGILDRFMERGGRTEQSLREFLDAMELREPPQDKEEVDSVQLLTLHACKGLEFPVVFLIGVEEDIIPHKTLGSNLAEERRLFYVGVTRAEKRLILTRCAQRRRHGRMVDAAPSRFLLEIPKELYVDRQSGRPIQEDRRKSMVADLFKKLDSLQP